MKKTLPFFLALTLTLVGGCNYIKNDNKPIIKVNKAVITQGMFDKTFESTIKHSPLKDTKNIDQSTDSLIYQIYKTQVVNDLVSRELIYEAAKKYNITTTDEEVNKLANQFITNIGGEKIFKKQLKENDITKKIFLKNIQRQIIINKLINIKLKDKQISDSEIKDYYEKNKLTEFSQPQLVKAQHILFAVSEQAIKTKYPTLSQASISKIYEEDLSKAYKTSQDVLQQLKSDPSKFDELASKYSDDKVSAKKGGDLGFFAKNNMVPEFSNAAFNLKPDKISNIVKTKYGLHIIKVNAVKKAEITPFNNATKAKIKEKLTVEMRNKTLTEILNDIRKNSKIVYINAKYDPNYLNTQLLPHQKNKN